MKQLQHIINNTFYHIEPAAQRQYPRRNFTTFVLLAFMMQAMADWEKPKDAGGYGTKVYAFETLVEPPRSGELYRRAGFAEVGLTQGVTCKRGPSDGQGGDAWGGKRVWDKEGERRPKLVFWKWVVAPEAVQQEILAKEEAVV